MSRVLVVGSANADLVYSVKEFPQPGQTISSLDFKIFAGGKGANQAVACARAGANVEFCACLGEDNFGEFLSQAITSNNVGIASATKSTEPTGSAVIFVNQSGENQIVLNPGANHSLSAESVNEAISTVQPVFMLTQLEVTDEAVMAVLSRKERVILNPAPFREISQYDLSGLLAITPNESECASLTGITPSSEHTTKEAANVLLAMGIQNAVITLGSRGCYWTNGQEDCFVSPPSVKPVDTTGAGDVFNGVLVARLQANDDFPNALSYAVKAASISTTRHGALESAPFMSEIDSLLP